MKIKAKVTKNMPGLKQFKKVYASIGETLSVGFFISGKGGLQHKKATHTIKTDYKGRNLRVASRKKTDPIIVEIAKWNNEGTKNIPARPFMEESFKGKKNTVKKQMAVIASSVLQLKEPSSATQIRVGNYFVGMVQKTIKQWVLPPNASSTVKSKGFNRPLTDTGQMAKAVEAIWERTKK